MGPDARFRQIPFAAGTLSAFSLPFDEYRRQALLVFPADGTGVRGQRFVRGHSQSFEIDWEVNVQTPVRKRELLSGDEHFPGRIPVAWPARQQSADSAIIIGIRIKFFILSICCCNLSCYYCIIYTKDMEALVERWNSCFPLPLFSPQCAQR